MSVKKRDCERFQSDANIVLLLCDGDDSRELAGPSLGSLCDVSLSGAAITVNPITFGDYHLVTSTQETPGRFLRLQINDFSISSRPIWYHLLDSPKEQRYRIGLEFITKPDQDQLEYMINNEVKSKQNWWKSTLSKLFP